MAQRWWPRAALLFTDIKKTGPPIQESPRKGIGLGSVGLGGKDLHGDDLPDVRLSATALGGCPTKHRCARNVTAGWCRGEPRTAVGALDGLADRFHDRTPHRYGASLAARCTGFNIDFFFNPLGFLILDILLLEPGSTEALTFNATEATGGEGEGKNENRRDERQFFHRQLGS